MCWYGDSGDVKNFDASSNDGVKNLGFFGTCNRIRM